MQCSNLQSRLLSSGKFPSLISFISSPCQIGRNSRLLRYRDISRFNSLHTTIRSQTSNVSIGGGDYEGGQGKDNHKIFSGSPTSASNSSSEYAKPNTRVPFPILVAGVLLGCALAFSLVSFLKGGPSAVLAAIAKSGFTAAFTLIFVSEIGDKIHSKRRNRLEQKRLNALVFVKYNLQLEQRELSRRGEKRKIDPICLSDMESDDEWITEIEDPTLPLVEDAWAGVSECFATQDLEATLKKPRKKSQATWWKSYGSPCPNLQRLAIRILSLTCSSTGCERNWSAFEHTFFIAALLAMQYEKGLVLLGSVGALSLMTILSVAIGRIFQSVPAQFQTTLPIGEYAAVALLMFFGFNAIKNAWELPSDATKSSEKGPELGEYVEAEELVKKKVANRLTSPLEIIWKSFSLVFVAEWGDRSMLATIALGAAQSPLGVATGAIAGHLIATSVAILGGAFLAKYISEKLVGYLSGVLFLLFSVATLLGVF